MSARRGFVSVGVGNNPRTNITEVHYRPGSIDKARAVQRYLGGTGRLTEDKTVVEADVSLILGPDFKVVTPPPGAAAPKPRHRRPRRHPRRPRPSRAPMANKLLHPPTPPSTERSPAHVPTWGPRGQTYALTT